MLQMSPFPLPLCCPPPPTPYPPFPLATTTLLSSSMSYPYVFLGSSLLLLSSSPPLPTPLWRLSVCSMCPCFCFCSVHQFILFIRSHIWVKSYGMCHSLTGLIWLSIIISGSIHSVAKGNISFFFMTMCTPLCECTTTFLSSHLLMGTWAASKSWLL